MYLIKVDGRYINFNNVTHVIELCGGPEGWEMCARIIYVDGSDSEVRGPEAEALIKFLHSQCLYRSGEGESMKQPPTSDPHSDPASLN